MEKSQIVVVDNGSQYTGLIARRCREQHVRADIIKPGYLTKRLQTDPPRCVILSGSYASIHDPNISSFPYELITSGIPVLGICFGFHQIAHHFRGTVRSLNATAQYGPATFTWRGEDFLFNNLQKTFTVWMSHGDSVIDVYTPEMYVLGYADGVIAAAKVAHLPWWGVQFHPEVEHTEFGAQIFANFLRFCKVVPDWNAQDAIAEIQREAERVIPAGTRVGMAYSGGVDSSVAAAILKSIGSDVLLITIDAGNLREGELKTIAERAALLECKHLVMGEAPRFFTALRDVTDGKQKRRVFRKIYWEIFNATMQTLDLKIFAQGTIHSDVTEAAGTGGDLVNIHHNIPENIATLFPHLYTLYEPLRTLYKDETREIGRALGLSDEIIESEPFPGPGLFVRIIGDKKVNSENIAALRWADTRVRKILREAGKGKEYAQVVVALGPDIAGVQGDHEFTGHSIFVRAVKTSTFMTAEGVYFEEPLFRHIEKALIGNYNIAAVFPAPTHKPPGRIEFQ